MAVNEVALAELDGEYPELEKEYPEGEYPELVEYPGLEYLPDWEYVEEEFGIRMLELPLFLYIEVVELVGDDDDDVGCPRYLEFNGCLTKGP